MLNVHFPVLMLLRPYQSEMHIRSQIEHVNIRTSFDTGRACCKWLRASNNVKCSLCVPDYCDGKTSTWIAYPASVKTCDRHSILVYANMPFACWLPSLNLKTQAKERLITMRRTDDRMTVPHMRQLILSEHFKHAMLISLLTVANVVLQHEVVA